MCVGSSRNCHREGHGLVVAVVAVSDGKVQQFRGSVALEASTAVSQIDPCHAGAAVEAVGAGAVDQIDPCHAAAGGQRDQNHAGAALVVVEGRSALQDVSMVLGPARAPSSAGIAAVEHLHHVDARALLVQTGMMSGKVLLALGWALRIQ